MTWNQIKLRVDSYLKRDGLDGTAEVHFPTNCGGKEIKEIYVGGDSGPECIVIKLGEIKK